jgi:stringent starvation protein B
MPDAPRPLPPKKEVALALLEREPSVYIHLDPRRPGVQVPKWFTNQPQLTLQVGLNMPIPIRDLEVGDEGISCTLSFQRSPFWCRMPWHAVWAIVGESQRGMVWPEDVPPEVVAQQQKAAAAPQKPAKRPRPRLAAVPSEPESGAEAAAETGAEAAAETGAEAAAETGAETAAETGAEAAAETGAEAAAATAAEPAAATAAEPAAATAAEPAEEPAARPPGGKPKRELPPYLRVIQ